MTRLLTPSISGRRLPQLLRLASMRIIRGRPSPFSCSILVTTKCMLKCKTCHFAQNMSTGRDFPLELLWRLGAELKAEGVRNLVITGGEPLTRGDIFKVADMLRGLGFSLTLITNGYLLKAQNVEEVCEKFDRIRISIDGLKSTHDQIRGRGSFERAINAARMLKAHGSDVQINTLIQRSNITELPAIIKYLQEEGLPVNLYFANTKGFGNVEGDFQPLINGDLGMILNLLKRMPAVLTVDDYFTLALKILSNKALCPRCLAPYGSIIINCDGEVYPCAGSNLSMGNIHENTLNQILRRREFEAFRKQAAKGANPLCAGCVQGCELEFTLMMTSIMALFKKLLKHLKSGMVL